MPALPFIQSGSTLTIFLGGVPKSVDTGHPNYDVLTNMVRENTLTTENADDIAKLIDYRQSIKVDSLVKYGKVEVGIDTITFDGRPIHSYLASVILRMSQDGIDALPWVKFMDKLYQNPSKTAIDELYLWLEKAQMPITPDGNFLAYKKVQDDFSSYHKGPDGPVMNAVGTTVEMPRNEVDDNRNKTCSQGLHFCSWHYLPSYYGGQGKVVILEIDPADVVSIPSDYDNAKGRASKYLVRDVIAEKDAEFAFNDRSVVDDYDDDLMDTYPVTLRLLAGTLSDLPDTVLRDLDFSLI